MQRLLLGVEDVAVGVGQGQGHGQASANAVVEKEDDDDSGSDEVHELAYLRSLKRQRTK